MSTYQKSTLSVSPANAAMNTISMAPELPGVGIKVAA